jgi:hypothetical protein
VGIDQQRELEVVRRHRIDARRTVAPIEIETRGEHLIRFGGRSFRRLRRLQFEQITDFRVAAETEQVEFIVELGRNAASM